MTGVTIGSRVRAQGLLGVVTAVHYSHGTQSEVYTIALDNGTIMRLDARHVVAA